MFRLRVPKRSSDLAARRAPDQTRDLGVDVYVGERRSRVQVKEMDGAVVAAAAGGDEAARPGAECYRFYGGGVRPAVFGAGWGDDGNGRRGARDGGGGGLDAGWEGGK